MHDDIVQTTAGRLRGRRGGGVRVFRGVPYGAPTGGPDRFKAPRPAVPWSGIRDAVGFGPSAWQPAGDPGFLWGGTAERSMGEDCLCLNVWAPDAPSGSVPVLVFLHGGGFRVGSGSWPAYDGSRLARRGDAVVVTVNHRLGAFGHLYLGELIGPAYAGSGAAGMLDIVLALGWVRDNVAQLGGDPERVLVFGESGGGRKVSTLLAMPAAAGLFSAAAVMSGPGPRCQSPARATELAERILAHLGIPAREAERVLTVDPAELIAAQVAVDGRAGPEPVRDGSLVVANPIDAVRSGSAPDVPLVVGTCRDEFRTFLRGTPVPDDTPDDKLARMLGGLVRCDHDAVVASYRARRPAASPMELLVAMATDGVMRVPSIELAEARLAAAGAPVWMYRFDWETPAMDGTLKAAHGVDYPFFFDNLDAAGVSSTGPGREALAARMSSALVALAATGDPNGDGPADWPAYELDQRFTMLFDVDSRAVADPSGDERLIWAAG